MNIREAAMILGVRQEQALEFIRQGVNLPKSGKRIYLKATVDGTKYDISNTDLNCFIKEREKEEPGRHPPLDVCRELLIEASHECAICRDSAPLQFHHMIEWSRIKAHDPKHMLAVCGTCHDKCNKGIIDYKAQLKYKERLKDYKGNRQSGCNRSIDMPTLADGIKVEIKINRDFDVFTDGEQGKILDAIAACLRMSGDIEVLSKDRGCVRLTIILQRDNAKELLRIAKLGQLENLGITDVHVIEAGDFGDMESKGSLYRYVEGVNQRFITLAGQLRDGNKKAGDQLLEACFEQISQLTDGYIRSKEGLDKAVIVAKVCDKIGKGISKFHGERDEDFHKWVDRIIQNTIKDEIKKIWKYPTISLDDAPTDKTSTAETPLDSCIVEESHRIVDRAIREMPEIYRVVLLLRFWESMKYSEIAVLLGIPIGTVRSRLSTARGILRGKLVPLLGEQK